MLYLHCCISTESDDYTFTSQLLEFSSSALQFEVDIPITNDVINEPVEQFFSRLTFIIKGTDVQLHPDEATIQIIDNDGTYFIFEHCLKVLIKYIINIFHWLPFHDM